MTAVPRRLIVGISCASETNPVVAMRVDFRNDGCSSYESHHFFFLAFGKVMYQPLRKAKKPYKSSCHNLVLH